MSGTAQELIVPDLDAVAIAQGQRTFNDKINDWAVAGFFGRLNYNYKERYLLELNGRYDGSGRYSSGNRWGFFPSVSVGWNMSPKNFFSDIKPVVNLQGESIAVERWVIRKFSRIYINYCHEVGDQANWIIDGKRYPYVKTPAILNMLRTWEKITTLNVGLELKFLDNRLSAEVDYFNRKS
ncbi:MAG: TonB-dependent receptor domain-containing protein [Parabacteroides sp.]